MAYQVNWQSTAASVKLTEEIAKICSAAKKHNCKIAKLDIQASRPIKLRLCGSAKNIIATRKALKEFEFQIDLP